MPWDGCVCVKRTPAFTSRNEAKANTSWCVKHLIKNMANGPRLLTQNCVDGRVHSCVASHGFNVNEHMAPRQVLLVSGFTKVKRKSARAPVRLRTDATEASRVVTEYGPLKTSV